jgi:hypothetical protein
MNKRRRYKAKRRRAARVNAIRESPYAIALHNMLLDFVPYCDGKA